MNEIDYNKTIIYGIRYKVYYNVARTQFRTSACVFMTENGRNQRLYRLKNRTIAEEIETFEYHLDPTTIQRI